MLQDDNINPASTMLSTPGDPHTSLFEDESSVSPVVAALTPDSLDLDERRYSETPQSTRQHSSQSTPELSDTKKPVKKRKSWGQELPTPKTNLPPRKRAKTEDEKEQRRIERVLRNRAAAQSSRERKRKEVEGLEDEKRNIELNNSTLAVRLTHAQRELRQLREQIVQLEQENTALRKMSLSLQGDIPTPDVSVKSFSPRIPSRLSISECASQIKAENEDPRSTSITPISLYLHPQQSNFFFQTNTDDLPREGPTATTPNLTQQPAELLCDLQCQLGGRRPPWGSSREAESEAVRQRQSWILSMVLLATMSQTLFLIVSSTVTLHLLHPMSQIFNSLMNGAQLRMSDHPRQQEIFSHLILWLISTEATFTTWTTPPLTTTTSHTPLTTSDCPLAPLPPSALSTRASSNSSRNNLLRRLLACSPALARPLRDATGRALHLEMSSISKTQGGKEKEVDHEFAAIGIDTRDGEEDIRQDTARRRRCLVLESICAVIDEMERSSNRNAGIETESGPERS